MIWFTDSAMTTLLKLLLKAQKSHDKPLDIKIVYQRKKKKMTSDVVQVCILNFNSQLPM